VKSSLVTLTVCYVSLAGVLTGQTVRDWTSNSDQRWTRNGNWSGSNRPDATNEVAHFGSGTQLNPELNANNYAIRGIRFGVDADSYDVSDDNGARTLKIGNGSGGFVENLSASDQVISIATLQFRDSSTIANYGTGDLRFLSDFTGNNSSLTFDGSGAIIVEGSILTGNGGLAKTGTGNLTLSGTNTYTGLTTIADGTISLGAANVFADSAAINLAASGTLRLSDLSDVIGQLNGDGVVDFGALGGGQLTLGSGASMFGGSFVGTGELIVGAGASLTLDADFFNSNLNITLDGGTLYLAGHDLSLGSLNISDHSIIDFGAGSDSTLSLDSLGFGSTGIILTAQNWADAADYFYSSTAYGQGAPPLNQVEFQGWSSADTHWQSYDQQITPVPEPGVYGAVLVGAGTLMLLLGRRRDLHA